MEYLKNEVSVELIDMAWSINAEFRKEMRNLEKVMARHLQTLRALADEIEATNEDAGAVREVRAWYDHERYYKYIMAHETREGQRQEALDAYTGFTHINGVRLGYSTSIDIVSEQLHRMKSSRAPI